MRIRFFTVSAPTDKEKALIPTILMVRLPRVITFTLGWWHWGIGIGFITSKHQPHDHR